MWIWVGFAWFCLTALLWLGAFAATENRRIRSGYQSLIRYAPYIQFMQDKTELNRFGIAQQLKRRFGPVISFGIPFNAMALLGGGALFFSAAGFSISGPLIVWVWPLLGLCALAVHACQAELMSAVPTAKGAAAAAAHLTGKGDGRLAALLQLGGQWAFVAFLNIEAARWLGHLWAYWQGGSAAAASAVAFMVFLSIQTILSWMSNSLYGNYQASAAVIQLLAGGILLLLLTLSMWPDLTYSALTRQTSALSTPVPDGGGWLLGVLLLWRMFVAGGSAEAAAEETVEPRIRLPWGQFQAAAYIYTAGYVLLSLVAMFGISRLFSGAAGPLPGAISTLWSHQPLLAGLLNLLVVFSLFFAALSILFASTRLSGALARESSSRVLATLGVVNSRWRSFTGTAVLAGSMSALFAVIALLLPDNWGGAALFLLVLGIILHHGAIMFPLASLLKRRKDAEQELILPLWSLGRVTKATRWLAVVALLAMTCIAAVGSPAAAVAAVCIGAVTCIFVKRSSISAAEKPSKPPASRHELLQLERSHPQ
ncbi:amino acid permease [Paenibacillus pasadenensis]|uniref:amino acid permease n=1 Tax=Paenibacillus pasadenensis TaxID=217090 RepID=UPI00204016B9|nr:amino acid permease [Paenibacillus pasadenensis]MCM3748912.1 amino acid permease [Paenibacillus pasadenensis]